jgi:hypothetical protein
MADVIGSLSNDTLIGTRDLDRIVGDLRGLLGGTDRGETICSSAMSGFFHSSPVKTCWAMPAAAMTGSSVESGPIN